MAGKATFIKNMSKWRGDARLYNLIPPLKWEGGETNFVVVSYLPDIPETYMFPSDSEGNVIDWGELDGSQKGDIPHSFVLREAGYEV